MALHASALNQPEPCSVEALTHLASAVLLVDEQGEVTFANECAREMLGCTFAPAMALKALLTTSGVEGEVVLPDQSTSVGTARLRLSDGRIIKTDARRLASGGCAVTLDDISQFMLEAERARIDLLTQLANRFTLQAELAQALGSGRPLTIFSLDLDRFKHINDTLGHGLGDALLRKVGERLTSLSEPGDVVARLGGDEFMVMRPNMTDRTEAETLALRIVDLVGRTYAIDGHMLNVGASVGVALAPDDGSDPGLLMKHADLALYSAKAGGRGRFRFFEPEMDARMQARRRIELELRSALALKQFELFYQPQIDLKTQEVVGFEALLRWRNGGSDLIAPSAFIPIAEETGLIVPIGDWVLRSACKEAAGWSRPVSVAVNLSPVQFRSARLGEAVTSALAHSGLEPGRLELEITEGALLEDTDAVVSTLKSLRALGVRVSMDDFGTGYSSLSYLQKFPFDKIKIDQSFVRDMQQNEEAGAIVRAVARLGSSLGMKTTAEGVETEEQLAAIRAEGCDHVQGYLTGRPMPSAQASALLAGNDARRMKESR